MSARVRELAVFIDGQRAGTLVQDGPNLHYSYTDDYRTDRQSTPLSVSMPLTAKAFPNRVIHPWIAGLLPDNDQVLARWSRQFHVAANPFALLGTQVGTDCAGAVQFAPIAEASSLDHNAKSVEWLTEARVAQRLRDLRTDSANWLGSASDGRFSLAGMQAKTALLLHNGDWGVPSGAMATTHILKPASNGLADHDLNEHICLRAARYLGLPAANTCLESFDTERALVVERYDRLVIDGVVRRIHQEDICQALIVDPSRKYQAEGGPGPQDVATLLRDVMPPGKANRAVWRFAEALIFNWAIGGTDAHAKNYSLLLHQDRVDLAPFYDVASALPYEATEHKLRLAMKIGSDYNLNTQRPQIWARLAKNLGLPTGLLRTKAEQMLDAIPDAFAQTCSERDIQTMGSDIPARLAELVERRAKTCLRSLSGSHSPTSAASAAVSTRHEPSTSLIVRHVVGEVGSSTA